MGLRSIAEGAVKKSETKSKIHIVLRHKKEGDSVSRWRNNGGWNKSHGTVEKPPRIDSFEAGKVDELAQRWAVLER